MRAASRAVGGDKPRQSCDVREEERPPFTDTDVTAGTQHVYRVKAINDAGAGGQSNYVNVDP